MNSRIALSGQEDSEIKQNPLFWNEENQENSDLKLMSQGPTMERNSNSLAFSAQSLKKEAYPLALNMSEHSPDEDIQIFEFPDNTLKSQDSLSPKAFFFGLSAGSNFQKNSDSNKASLSITFSLEAKESFGPAWFNSDDEQIESNMKSTLNPLFFSSAQDCQPVEQIIPKSNFETNNTETNSQNSLLSSNKLAIQLEEIPVTVPSTGHRRGRKSHFSPEEDRELIDLVNKYGERSWFLIANEMGKFNRKQVRDHYIHFIKHKNASVPFSSEEDELLLSLLSKHGHNWQLIAKSFPERNSIALKNRNTTLEKRRKKQKMEKKKLTRKRRTNEQKKLLSDQLFSATFTEFDLKK